MKRQKPIVLIIIVVALVASLVLRQRNFKERAPWNDNREHTETGSNSRRESGQPDLTADQDERSTRKPGENTGRSGNNSSRSDSEPEFDRTLSKIVYTKHARCRMDCRKIDESEILEIRDEGKVNYAKSELKSRPDPKFAVEGMTHDKQFVRVVFAQTSNSLVVVTCIDLDTDWSCSCN